MSGVRYEFQKKKTGFVVCFYRNKMSTVREAYDVLEDGDKKPINPEKADKKPINTKKADKNPSINGRTRKNRPNYRLYQCTRRNYK